MKLSLSIFRRAGGAPFPAPVAGVDASADSEPFDLTAGLSIDEKNALIQNAFEQLEMLCDTMKFGIDNKLTPDTSLSLMKPEGSIEFFMIQNRTSAAGKRFQESPLLVQLSLHLPYTHDPTISLEIRGPAPHYFSDVSKRPVIFKDQFQLDQLDQIAPQILSAVLDQLQPDQRKALDVTVWPWSYQAIANEAKAAVPAPAPVPPNKG